MLTLTPLKKKSHIQKIQGQRKPVFTLQSITDFLKQCSGVLKAFFWYNNWIYSELSRIYQHENQTRQCLSSTIAKWLARLIFSSKGKVPKQQPLINLPVKAQKGTSPGRWARPSPRGSAWPLAMPYSIGCHLSLACASAPLLPTGTSPSELGLHPEEDGAGPACLPRRVAPWVCQCGPSHGHHPHFCLELAWM